MATKSIILISDYEPIYKFLGLACMHLPVKVIRARDAEAGLSAARSDTPSMIFIDANDFMMDKGWMMAQLIKTDAELSGVRVVVLSDARDADQLARKHMVDGHLPRCLPLTTARKLIEDCIQSGDRIRTY